MIRYFMEPRIGKYVKRYEFLPFARHLSNKYGKQLLDKATKTGLDAVKITSKEVVHKEAEATGESIGNKLADKIVKPKLASDENSRNVEEIVIPPHKKQTILSKYYKMEYHKISKLLSDSTVSKFVTRKCIKVNDLSGISIFCQQEYKV